MIYPYTMASQLVIVESPTKAKTIRKFLGPEYAVTASMGHVRDLPASADEIPEAYKKESWAQLGVNVDDGFEPIYVVPENKKKTISDIKKLMKGVETVYLATDEDREGESISWHLMDILKPKVPVKRMVFHEITKQAIQEALEHTRSIDERLVRAQETRRILDRLVGYTISPVLWKKIAYGLSAGRVQSVALKAVVDRERQRLAFRKAGYWDVEAELDQNGKFNAKLVSTGGKRLAIGKDFDEQTGQLKSPDQVILLDEAATNQIAEAVLKSGWKITDITEKPMSRKAPAPFTTSTLQQESNRKLGLSARDTMRAAQGLYEKGHITYMRTDSVTLSEDAVRGIRAAVDQRFGSEYLTEEAKRFATTSKGAQEAHEAIRPSLTFATPDELGLKGTERDLYELIWMRTLACQMRDSKQAQTTVLLDAAGHTFQATGMQIIFPGFLRAYIEGAEDVDQALEDKDRSLPPFKVGDSPKCLEAKATSHETKPPARFTEASLVHYMEKEGIGRPSTYASTISTIVDRGYVRKTGNALIPTFTGFAVTQLLERHFADLVDVQFTSKMEQVLDKIAEGEEDWKPYLTAFYKGEKGLAARIVRELGEIDPEAAKTVTLPGLEGFTVKVGKFGPYVESKLPQTGALVKTSLTDDLAPGDISREALEELLKKAQQGPTCLGNDPVSSLPVFLRTGAYGPFLQLGEDPADPKSKDKPKRASVPKQVPLNTLDLKKALSILALPRTLGQHAVSGKDVKAGIGRFGPYIVHDGDFRSLKKEDDVLTVTFERALELLAIPKMSRGGRAGKVVGNHPEDGKPITLHSGKFGAYVKHGRTNATLPENIKPESITLEQAVDILANKKAPKSKKKQ